MGALNSDARPDKELTRRAVLGCHLCDRAGAEPDISQHLEPQAPRKEAEFVRVVHQMHGAVGLSKQEGVIRAGAGISRVRVAGPGR